MNPIANKRFTLQGCSQHPRYKGSGLNIQVTWPISPPGGYHLPTMGWSNPVVTFFHPFHHNPWSSSLEILNSLWDQIRYRGRHRLLISTMTKNAGRHTTSPSDLARMARLWDKATEKSGVNADCQPETWTEIDRYIYIHIYYSVYIVYIYSISYIYITIYM
jgi:hypothetical protein